MNNKKWVLVTGGTKGIGRGLLENLVQNDYRVIFTYKSSNEIADELQNKFNQEKIWVQGYRCDGSCYDDVERLCAQLISTWGAPHALVNNMGIAFDELIFNFDIHKCHEVISTNMSSAFYFNKCLIPAMCEQGDGYVLQMSSVSAFKGNPGQTSYAATKAGLIGMTKALALEVARFNIKVNAIAPGFISTELTETMTESASQRIIKSIPLRRVGSVEDVANLVCFLISGKADYMTGHTFVIDGGLSI